MTIRKNQFNLFDQLGFTPKPRPQPKPVEPAAPKPSAREDHRGHVAIETMLKCFSNPTIFCINHTSAIPPPHDFLKKNRMLIELERAARLMKLLHDKPAASLDEIRACATILTNPEIAGVLSVLSGLSPLRSEAVAEYMRAFSHCFEFDELMMVFGEGYGDAINVNDVERFYQLQGGRDGFGYLDKAERQWIKDFNEKVKQARSKAKPTK